MLKAEIWAVKVPILTPVPNPATSALLSLAILIALADTAKDVLDVAGVVLSVVMLTSREVVATVDPVALVQEAGETVRSKEAEAAEGGVAPTVTRCVAPAPT